jgi:hypothetical protein
MGDHFLERAVGCLAALCLGLAAVPAVGGDNGLIDFSGAAIVAGQNAADLETLAARELQRYLKHVSATPSPIVAAAPGAGPCILLGTPRSHAGIAALAQSGAIQVSKETLGEEGFVIKVLPGAQPRLVLAAAEPRGVLWSVYAFLERLGFGFYLGGDAIAGAEEPRLAADLSITTVPTFATRGSLPWYNFLDSPTTWDRDDYRYFFDQMAKMRMNFVGFHSYDGEPFCAYPWKGKLEGGEPLVTARGYGWGGMRGMKTEEFGFGTGDFFFGPEFGSRAVTEAKGREDAIHRAQALLADGLHYARSRGLKVCVGFEVSGDPTNPEVQQRLVARLEALLRAYPMLDYVWLWQSEGLGGGSDPALRESQLGMMADRYAAEFQYLGDARRVHEAVRVMLHARLGHAMLKRLASNVRLVISGWGGDRWMRFSDFYVGLDRTLPGDVIFAALDNIDPSAATTVAEAYGKLSPTRQRWPMPWWESDGGGTRRDQWGPQCNARPVLPLCRDALAKKCQGMLAIHWRTRDVEEAAALEAQFAWNPRLTYEQFYDDFARRCYGLAWAAEMGAIHRELEALGPRYTGALGQTECGSFCWFDDGRQPKPENLAKLAALRDRIARLRRDMVEVYDDVEATIEHRSARRREMMEEMKTAGLARIDWLLTTIDWLTRYDAVAVVLCKGGKVDRLLAEAELKRGDGDQAGAAKLAVRAGELVRNCGFADALRTYPWKMTTCGEWGTLATINVKAYAAFERLAAQIKSLGGDPGPITGALPATAGPRIVMRTPPSIVEPGKAVEVAAIVIADRPKVTLRYRRAGHQPWQSVAMENRFRRAWTGVIPAAAVTRQGIEYRVDVRDAAGHTASAPGGPTAAWSASGLDLPAPAVFHEPALAVAGQAKDLTAEPGAGYEVVLRWTPPAGCAGFLVTRNVEGKAAVAARTRLAEFIDLYPVPGATVQYTVAALDAQGKPGPTATAQARIAEQSPPPKVEGLAAVAGPGNARLTWRPLAGKLGGYQLLRRPAGGEARPVAATPLPTESLLDVGLDAVVEYTYQVRAVDRAGRGGELSAPVTIRPLARQRGPVFHAAFEGSGDAGRIKPQAVGSVRFAPGIVGKALDSSHGGYFIYPHQKDFELDGEFAIELWFRAETLRDWPVLASCGEFAKHGWFVQIIGGQIRFSLGGENLLDAAPVSVGQWHHLACTYDTRTMRVYLDGKQRGVREVSNVDFTPWTGPLYVAQYHYLTDDFQFRGLLDELKLYRLVPTAAEIARTYEAGKKPR